MLCLDNNKNVVAVNNGDDDNDVDDDDDVDDGDVMFHYCACAPNYAFTYNCTCTPNYALTHNCTCTYTYFLLALTPPFIRLDLSSGQSSAFGQHGDAIKSVRSCPESGLLFTGSWDKSVGGWDGRSEQRGKQCCKICCNATQLYSILYHLIHLFKLQSLMTTGRHLPLFKLQLNSPFTPFA